MNSNFILRVAETLVALAASGDYIYLARTAWYSEERKNYIQLSFPIGQTCMIAFVGYSEILFGLVLIEMITEPAKDTIVSILLIIGVVVNFITALALIDFIYKSEQNNLWFITVGLALLNIGLMIADLFLMLRNKD